jgi:glucosyl-3-phosphoglycerate synthase
MLCEVFRREDPRLVCQVDGGSGYDHKHQPAATSLAPMCGEIAQELFSQLATEGIDQGILRPEIISDAYRKEAAVALKRSANLALINGLPFNEQAESEAVAAFARELSAISSARRASLPALHQVRDAPAAIAALASDARLM